RLAVAHRPREAVPTLADVTQYLRIPGLVRIARLRPHRASEQKRHRKQRCECTSRTVHRTLLSRSEKGRAPDACLTRHQARVIKSFREKLLHAADPRPIWRQRKVVEAGRVCERWSISHQRA